jgi:streptomycin 6-kinase
VAGGVALAIPESLRGEVGRFRDGLGLRWLDRLPRLVADACDRWSLSLGEAFPYPSLSFVAPAVRSDGSPVVLKVGFLADELACEIEALRWYDGRGCVRLHDSVAADGVLLLERLLPGTSLELVVDDAEATCIAAGAMRALWRPAPAEHGFPTVADWLDGLRKLRAHFGGGTGPLPARLVARAERLRAELLASRGDPVLLHGDLQHYNILRAKREPWLAIDPKGVVGEPAYEVGAFLRNRYGGTDDPGRLLARRVDQFAEELGLDRRRVAGWGLVGAVLSAWWSIEDGGDWREAIECAELLAGTLDRRIV